MRSSRHRQDCALVDLEFPRDRGDGESMRLARLAADDCLCALAGDADAAGELGDGQLAGGEMLGKRHAARILASDT